MKRRPFALVVLVASVLLLLVAQGSSAARRSNPSLSPSSAEKTKPKKCKKGYVRKHGKCVKVKKAKPKPTPPPPPPPPPPPTPAEQLAKVNHIVVVYEENHSFDNLYGGWEGVNGLSNATGKTTQVNQAGTPYACLMQNDVNLTSPPLTATCNDSTTGPVAFTSAFTNAPFTIDTYIPKTATTCPPGTKAFSTPKGTLNGTGLPGGCTRDMVHKFYQEQYAIDGGKMDRYVTGSDGIGLAMGAYDTKQLPIYQYLHAASHPNYAIADNFFAAAFGGSFLNHQWLIAASTPTFPNPPDTLRAILDTNGMVAKYDLYNPTGPVRDGAVSPACPAPVPSLPVCGDFGINTLQPTYKPSGTFGSKIPPQTAPTIGDRLNDKSVDWAWYGGGWSNANGDVNGPGWTNGSGTTCTDPNVDPTAVFPNCADIVFQYHHQPFNYFTNYAPGTAARTAHLRDEVEFLNLAKASTSTCGLKAVNFVKPIGQENEHPGYASEPKGSDHLVSLIQAVESGACAKDTMVVVVYDEFGGQFDHVPPPGFAGTAGPHDMWGPGTRIPALIISPNLAAPYVVDHTQHDTTSILATIEHRYSVSALGTRDAAVPDLSSVFAAKAP